MEISNWKLSARGGSALGGKVACITAFLFAGLAFVAFATDFSSTDYKVSAPVLFSGEYSTSTGYQLFGNISQIAIGTSTITGYQVVSGFLYFPVVTAPVPSATAGSGQVSLTWSAATAAQGWSIGGYNVGQSTTAGGPYTYSASLGNVTSSVRTGLTNGTTYYFIVRAEDTFNRSIATSSEVSAAPVASSVSPPVLGGGAPGSVTVPMQNIGRVEISGLAYPRGRISLLIDGRITASVVAGSDASFSHVLSSLGEGTYVLGIVGQDEVGFRSPLVTVPLDIKRNATTRISGVLVPPTITTDRIEVRAGDLVIISGRSIPHTSIRVSIEYAVKAWAVEVLTTDTGAYSYSFDTNGLAKGRYTARSRVTTAAGPQSAFSLPMLFEVGEKIRERELITICKGTGVLAGDVNNDCRVNIVDFSILAYWFSRQRTNDIPLQFDLTGDGRIDLADFSVAAYYWTG